MTRQLTTDIGLKPRGVGVVHQRPADIARRRGRAQLPVGRQSYGPRLGCPVCWVEECFGWTRAWRSESGLDVAVVAKRLVLRLSTSAQGAPRQPHQCSVLVTDDEVASDRQWSVLDGRHHRGRRGLLAELPVEASVLERAGGAVFDDPADFIRGGIVGQDPRTSVPVEHRREPANAFGRVDAQIAVEAHLEVGPPVGPSRHMRIIRDLILPRKLRAAAKD